MTRYDDLLSEVQELRREVADLRDDDEADDETIPEGQAQAVEDLCDRLLWYRSRGWSTAEAEAEAELESIAGHADIAVLREQLPDREPEDKGDDVQQRIADLEDTLAWYNAKNWDTAAEKTRREIEELKS
jgi:hypothetical protein